MIQHVGLEIRAHDADAEVAFWALLGFAEVDPPDASLAQRSRWVQDDAGFQVHLLWADAPTVPDTGHLAVVVGPRYGPVDRGAACRGPRRRPAAGVLGLAPHAGACRPPATASR